MPAVTPDRVRELTARFRPGRVIPFSTLYADYAHLAQASGEVPAHPSALVAALAVAGWSKGRRQRKLRGKRGEQRIISEERMMTIPGAPENTEEDDLVCAVLLGLIGDAESAPVPQADIQDAYRRHSADVRWPMGDKEVSAWLNRNGFARFLQQRRTSDGLPLKSVPCRVVDRAHLHRLSPIPGYVPVVHISAPVPPAPAVEVDPTEDLFVTVDEL